MFVITLDLAPGSNRLFLLHDEFSARSQVGLWPFGFILTAASFNWCQTYYFIMSDSHTQY